MRFAEKISLHQIQVQILFNPQINVKDVRKGLVQISGKRYGVKRQEMQSFWGCGVSI